MALQYVEFDARCDPRLCDTVTLCLQSFWSARTVSGVALIYGTVRNVLGKLYVQDVCNPTCPPAPVCSDPCENICRYLIEIDDSQLLVNTNTNLKYVVTAADILEASQLSCIVERLLANSGGGGGGGYVPPARAAACGLGYFPIIPIP
jgi:hypothetical protein